ncbi:GNAT family N-acetyltransferase [Marinobacter zhejiangensis]|uniref:Protein N-acetyltransferase, RimJ/RimL family n=1 Tax=Marinobacter zhejiangensis TaxID=488535 RepID=A0A1I4QQP2_9GAMM|nr:GNAT family N-acetyltransferase [Marinobacter zhejiangensis]SFM42016.1 Protein N-acetyltransferase, RimJ/RimL family [Marinobacter zhejiangensis]
MKLESKNIRLRLVNEDDADFILKLRLDERYNRFLSAVNPDIAAQKQWIRQYQADESAGLQYYFIIERIDGVRCGTIRVYDLREDSFCWGSWILNEDKTKYSAVESAFLVYKFGFEELGFKKSHFDVMKGNDKVISFHKRMGATEIGEDEDNYYFEITQSSVEVAKERLKGKLR